MINLNQINNSRAWSNSRKRWRLGLRARLQTHLLDRWKNDRRRPWQLAVGFDNHHLRSHNSCTFGNKKENEKSIINCVAKDNCVQTSHQVMSNSSCLKKCFHRAWGWKFVMWAFNVLTWKKLEFKLLPNIWIIPRKS